MPDVEWWDLLVRIAVAAALTGAIGLERELRERAAGLRTHMLVGVGSALLEAVVAAARRAGCRRVWFITTNDNLPMLRFSQKRGFSLVAVYPKALDESRKLKEISEIGLDGIPLRVELELERLL